MFKYPLEIAPNCALHWQQTNSRKKKIKKKQHYFDTKGEGLLPNKYKLLFSHLKSIIMSSAHHTQTLKGEGLLPNKYKLLFSHLKSIIMSSAHHTNIDKGGWRKVELKLANLGIHCGQYTVSECLSWQALACLFIKKKISIYTSFKGCNRGRRGWKHTQYISLSHKLSPETNIILYFLFLRYLSSRALARVKQKKNKKNKNKLSIYQTQFPIPLNSNS